MGIADGELETAEEMSRALRARLASAVELVERALERADAWQPSTNAFSQLWPDEALGEARRVDAARTGEDASVPSFAGVPIAIKDLYDVAGHETTGCCSAYRGRMAERDAPVIERLRAAGLVMIGKTNQHELAAGGTNLASACGRTGNPWDGSRITGGSSGGSGAATAAGVVPWALGSDTGGSIRIPASLCGTFGLKPTTGRLSIEGLLPLAPSMDCPGPMAATLGDLGALWTVLSGDPPDDASGPARPAVGVPGGYFDGPLHDVVRAAIQTAADALDSSGATVESTDGPSVEHVRTVWMDVTCPEFWDAHPALHEPERRALLHPQVRGWLERGERMSEAERDAATRRRLDVGRWFDGRLERFDALLVPTTPYPAPRAADGTVSLGRDGTIEVDRVGAGWLTCTVNLAGLPAINVPAGRSAEGMPVGVSLIGRRGDEAGLLRIAARLAAALDIRVERPPVPS